MDLTIDQALQRGIEAHKAGQLQEAERLYRLILQKVPKHPDANHNLGVLAVTVNKAEAALPLFKVALEANPNQGQFWLSYIETLIKEKQFDIAKNVLEQGKQLGLAGEKVEILSQELVRGTQEQENQLNEKSQSATSAGQAKRVSVKKGKQEKSTTTHSQRKSIQVRGPSQLEVTALLKHYQEGQYEVAEKLARLITQQYPDHQFGWKALGAVLNQAGRTLDSLGAHQKAAELDPQDADAHNKIGATLNELGRLEDAETSYNKAIGIKPALAEGHYNSGDHPLNLSISLSGGKETN